MIYLTANNYEDCNLYRLIETESGEYMGRCAIYKFADRYELWNVRIFDEFQTKGYGTYMLKEIIKRYKKFMKCKKFILYVLENNDIAINLYRKLGFEIVSTNENIHKMQFMEEKRNGNC